MGHQLKFGILKRYNTNASRLHVSEEIPVVIVMDLLLYDMCITDYFSNIKMLVLIVNFYHFSRIS